MGLSDFQIHMLQSLWRLLTPKETYGLLVPDYLVNKGANFDKVRRSNLLHLLDLERQMHELRCEEAVWNGAGKIIRAETLSNLRKVEISPVIEPEKPVFELDERRIELHKLKSVAQEIDQFLALERLIRLQKIILHTERTILKLSGITKTDTLPERRWFDFWKLKACQVTNGALQQLWVNVLVKELRQPGSTRIRSLEHLSTFDLQDAKDLSVLEGWRIGSSLHSEALLENCGRDSLQALRRMTENGWIESHSNAHSKVTLRSQSRNEFRLKIEVGGKCYLLTSPGSELKLRYPALKMKLLGEQVVGLVDPVTDGPYIDQVLKKFAHCGVSVNKLTK